MHDVRMGVDDIDRQLSQMLGIRFRYMEAAAHIKSNRSDVRDETRKAQVIANARANAAEAGWAPEIAAALWDQLVEASIAHELAIFDTR